METLSINKKIASELLKIAKKLTADYNEYLRIITPSGQIFHKEDFAISDFDEALKKLLKNDGALVSSNIKNNLWEVVMEFKDEDDIDAFVEKKLTHMKEFLLMKKYGAKLEVM